MLVILHLPPDPFSALPVLCPSNLFSMHLPDSFLLWLLAGLANENHKPKNGGCDGREDTVLTPSDSYHASIISMEPPRTGSAVVWLSYLPVQASLRCYALVLLHSLYFPPPCSYLINSPFTKTPFHSILWRCHLFPVGTWEIRYEHFKFGHKSIWTEKNKRR